MDYDKVGNKITELALEAEQCKHRATSAKLNLLGQLVRDTKTNLHSIMVKELTIGYGSPSEFNNEFAAESVEYIMASKEADDAVFYVFNAINEMTIPIPITKGEDESTIEQAIIDFLANILLPYSSIDITYLDLTVDTMEVA